MTLTESNRAQPGFTLVELLTVLAIIGILAALLLPSLGQAKARAHRVTCAQQLQQLGLAAHSFAHDHDGKFPPRVAPAAGGTQFVPTAAPSVGENFAPAFRHLQALSNELVTPKILRCPTDDRVAVGRFVDLQSDNVSYFVAVNAEWGRPTSVLAGDRNLTVPATTSATTAASVFRWTGALHKFRGNLLFADGHVEQHNNHTLATPASALAAGVLQFPHPSDSAARAADYAPPVPPQTTPVPSGPESTSPSGQARVIQVATPFALLRIPMPAPADLGSPDASVETLPVPVVINVAAEAEAPVQFGESALEYVRGLIKRGYALLLLLLLVLLAVAIWREWQKWDERRARHLVSPLEDGPT